MVVSMSNTNIISLTTKDNNTIYGWHSQLKITKDSDTIFEGGFIDGTATNTLEQVFEYKHKELSVIALASKSKKPRLLKWEEYQHVLASEDQLKQWFSSTGNHNNVGIITGAVSKYLLLI